MNIRPIADFYLFIFFATFSFSQRAARLQDSAPFVRDMHAHTHAHLSLTEVMIIDLSEQLCCGV